MRYNVEYARSVSKADWMELHKEDAAEVDLSAEYDKMVPPKKAAKEPETDKAK